MAICAVILISKLLLPGFIGMASNGDFGKVIGPLCVDGADHGANNFIFFQSDYVRGKEYCYTPPYYSSETALAWLASSLERTFSDPIRLDIRWMGAIHGLLFLGLYLLVLVLLRPLRPGFRFAMSAAALWIFADAGLIVYLNSFFTDAPAILGGLAALVLALLLGSAATIRALPLVLFGCASLAFVLSKAQHGLLGPVAAAFLLYLAYRETRRSMRAVQCSLAALVLAATVWMFASTPGSYTAQARFNLIFFYLVPHSRTAAQDLLELGLEPGDVRYAGLTAYSPKGPMLDATWRTAFEARTSYGSLLGFYLRHPSRVLAKLRSDLWNEAPNRRVIYLSNYRRDAGRPAGARDPQFGSWSALRARLFRWWPAHILIWLALALCAPWLSVRAGTSSLGRSLPWAISAIALLAITEYLTVSLADAIETDRHLLLFHVFTDLTIFLAAVLLCESWPTRALDRSGSVDQAAQDNRPELRSGLHALSLLTDQAQQAAQAVPPTRAQRSQVFFKPFSLGFGLNRPVRALLQLPVEVLRPDCPVLDFSLKARG